MPLRLLISFRHLFFGYSYLQIAVCAFGYSYPQASRGVWRSELSRWRNALPLPLLLELWRGRARVLVVLRDRVAQLCEGIFAEFWLFEGAGVVLEATHV